MNRHNHKKKDIYIIKNDINNKVYIGQTVNPKQRCLPVALSRSANGQEYEGATPLYSPRRILSTIQTG